MYPRTNYEMTQADLEKILDACKPTVCIKIGTYEGSTPQENANRAWAELGSRMGFDSMTVEQAPGGMRFFTAIPSETPEAKAEREHREKVEAHKTNIARLEKEVEEAKNRLMEALKP